MFLTQGRAFCSVISESVRLVPIEIFLVAIPKGDDWAIDDPKHPFRATLFDAWATSAESMVDAQPIPQRQ